ncbi:hypothetical protein B0H11DRAFT_2193454 [Mycena galericulata]|nr:hypothetical protein B0H11DRAFT_2193454 [Mycena galericulata]
MAGWSRTSPSWYECRDTLRRAGEVGGGRGIRTKRVSRVFYDTPDDCEAVLPEGQAGTPATTWITYYVGRTINRSGRVEVGEGKMGLDEAAAHDAQKGVRGRVGRKGKG